MNDLCIDVEGLNKHFGDQHVVKDLSLQIGKGEIYGFLGPNGSGKTTSIRMMCGLMTPDSGLGHCLGYDIFTQRDNIKKRIGYKTQYFSMWGALTVRENLLFIARLHNLKPARQYVDKTLSEMGLSSRQNQLAKDLSGGWKQRLALAASMIHQPGLLFLDEPTAGVDPKSRRDFWQILHWLSDRGISILVSTHYMDEAERCHQLAYLAYGKLLAHGTAQSIIDAQKLTTIRISGQGLTSLEAKLRCFPEIQQTVIFGRTLHVTSSDNNNLARILSKVVPDGYGIQEVGTTLEDAFSHLMKPLHD